MGDTAITILVTVICNVVLVVVAGLAIWDNLRYARQCRRQADALRYTCQCHKGMQYTVEGPRAP